MAQRKRTKKKKTGRRVRLKPADPFELIRWLARSQSDPRKAVAELVQNSLDAGARRVEIIRRRMRGVSCLHVLDDGEGVIPEMSREEALHYLATHIGHSRKLGLTPAERHRRVVAGQYGVGLLGFWSIGGRLELRTRVSGSELMALQLREDKPSAHIERLPTPLDAPVTYTEVVVSEVHPTAGRLLGGRRLSEYLAAELRGQLSAHQVELTIEDKQARGTAQKRFRVVPRRFVGQPLQLPAQVDVTDQQPARIEIYLATDGERPAIQLACAGTLVADDIAELHTLGLDGSPWVGCGLTGIIDFAGFTVPPGTRRGVSFDAPAQRFVEAMLRLQPEIDAELQRLESERVAATDREVVRELRRALRGFRRRLPQYELPAVQRPGDGEPGDAGAGETLGHEALGEGLGVTSAPAELFPPGPLAAVSLQPDPVRVVAGRERRLHAVASDADGRRLRDGVDYAWSVTGAGLELRGNGSRPALAAEAQATPHSGGRVTVTASSDGASFAASVAAHVIDEEEAGAALGVPEPALISEPTAAWRSRMQGERWEVNSGHEDYVSLQSEPRARLRYLLMLLAKEMVNRSYGRPGDAELLERVVEILAHVERNLRGR